MLEQKNFHELVARFPEVAIQIFENLSLQLGRADELIRDLSDTAMRDALTGMLNRRAYEQRLREEVDRSRRYSEHFSLILTDLDHFKFINDTYGHDTGDIVLHWIGRLLTEHTRSPDTPFRIGGEEFAILAPATNMVVAHLVAQRLVDIVSEARPPLDFELKVTMSAGFACFPDHGESVSVLFGLADKALLRAKAEGRNRVCGPPAASCARRPGRKPWLCRLNVGSNLGCSTCRMACWMNRSSTGRLNEPTGSGRREPLTPSHITASHPHRVPNRLRRPRDHPHPHPPLPSLRIGRPLDSKGCIESGRLLLHRVWKAVEGPRRVANGP